MEYITFILEYLAGEVAPLLILILELLGILMIVWGVLKAFVALFKNHFDLTDKKVKIRLFSSMSFAIDIMLCAEIINTILIKDLMQLMIFVTISILRIIIGFVLAWEMKHECSE